MTALPSVEDCKAITRRRLREEGRNPDDFSITIIYRRGTEWLPEVKPLRPARHEGAVPS